ncbi:MAG: maltooligosyltrehalose trehalohydrolase, partial [Mycobacterium sp.]|nr:maltooligosyltrehalose trehalohydrolase [Mycobacterium sp.]
RWIALHRGSLTVACNLGADPVPVPFTGEVVLGSEPISAGEQSTDLPSHSFVILRSVDN